MPPGVALFIRLSKAVGQLSTRLLAGRLPAFVVHGTTIFDKNRANPVISGLLLPGVILRLGVGQSRDM